MTCQQEIDIAVEHHRAGQLSHAETIYRQILAVEPRHAEALHLLGVIAHQSGQFDVALNLIKQAIAIQPHYPEAYNNHGGNLQAMGRLDEAIAAFRQAVVLNPEFADPQNSLWSIFGTDTRRGLEFWDDMDLDRTVSALARKLARYYLYWYAPALREVAPSFEAQPIAVIPPPDYHPGAPSVARIGEDLFLMHRMVNYTIMNDGSVVTVNGGPIASRNFLLRLNDDLTVISSEEILPPVGIPVHPLMTSFEDSALFEWKGEMWAISTVMSPERVCKQVLLRVDREAGWAKDWRIMKSPNPVRHEKNWMPLVHEGKLSLVYLCDPTITFGEDGSTTAVQPQMAGECFRGGSQLVAFDGGYVAMIHEVSPHPEGLWRFYSHRFVWFEAPGRDAASPLRLRKVSRPFYLHRKHIEYVRGMTWHRGRLVMSFQINDAESHLGEIEPNEVRALLGLPEPGESTRLS
jgi:Tetratricopeptide repeat